ncbi:MAG: 7-carboxy-7-deazaguanine synthase QueE [Candidatus Rifleibacteriota bacterium]
MKQSKIQGNISEIFASIQGEGLYIGTMQLFIRLSGCKFRCKRCELKEFQQDQEFFSIRPFPGLRSLKMINPVTPEALIKKLEKVYNLNDFFCISLLGGEPLQQCLFVERLLKLLKQKNLRTFIETNGLLPDEYIRVKDLADLLCVDLKISKAWGFNGKLEHKHRKIITNSDPTKTYFRILLDSNDDSEAIISQIQSFDMKEFDLVLQPFSYAPSHINDWDTSTILEWIKLFKPYFRRVRWIPQVHKLLRII